MRRDLLIYLGFCSISDKLVPESELFYINYCLNYLIIYQFIFICQYNNISYKINATYLLEISLKENIKSIKNNSIPISFLNYPEYI